MSENRFKDVIRQLLEMSYDELEDVYEFIGRKLVPGPRKSDYYLRTMSEVVGFDVMNRSRRNDALWARYIVLYQLLEDGWNTTRAGGVFGLDHSTVSNAKIRVLQMLDMPGMYRHEYELYRDFKHRISGNEGMRMEG